MRNNVFWIFTTLLFVLANCNQPESDGGKKEPAGNVAGNKIIGKWIRKAPGPATSLHFHEDGTVEGDLMMDGQVEVKASYSISGNRVEIRDSEGQTCPGTGVYQVTMGDHYVGFDLVDDTCYGRIRAMMGYWTKPGYEDIMIDLDQALEENKNPGLLLERARVLMALGKSEAARTDLDAYLETDSTNAKVYMNRAGTRFPFDLHGVINDCNKAIALDPEDKNSYFMRGLARYEMGKKAEACEDFSRAIELGFTFIRKSQAARCTEFWEDDTKLNR